MPNVLALARFAPCCKRDVDLPGLATLRASSKRPAHQSGSPPGRRPRSWFWGDRGVPTGAGTPPLGEA